MLAIARQRTGNNSYFYISVSNLTLAYRPFSDIQNGKADGPLLGKEKRRLNGHKESMVTVCATSCHLVAVSVSWGVDVDGMAVPTLLRLFGPFRSIPSK